MLVHTRTIWYLVAILGSVSACGTKIAQTTYQQPADYAGSDAAISPTRPPPCGPTLKERLTITTIPVDENIRYKRIGYGGFPNDARIAMDAQQSGASQVAWLDNALEKVHVTPLTADETRAAALDTIVEGFDIGGLVAHEDGFALLTRRNDPGDAIGDIPDAGPVAPAAFLVRWQNNREIFAAPLTGTRNITNDAEPYRHDCTTGLFGRLAFNDYFYGAYFVDRGCKGDIADGRYGDKLVYAEANGLFRPGGWRWGCSQNLGLRLLPEPNEFTSLCMADDQPQPGLNLVVNGQSRLIAREATSPGYSPGEFGSVVKLADGRYLLVWATRGWTRNAAGVVEPGYDTHDVAIVFLSRSYVPIGNPSWLFQTAGVDEFNVHVAPYGASRILLTWNTITSPTCSAGRCLGTYGGTHFRLMDLDANFLGAEEIIEAPPNDGEDIVVFPNLDLGWAYVAGPREYSVVLDDAASAPPMKQLSIAKLTYCMN